MGRCSHGLLSIQTDKLLDRRDYLSTKKDGADDSFCITSVSTFSHLEWSLPYTQTANNNCKKDLKGIKKQFNEDFWWIFQNQRKCKGQAWKNRGKKCNLPDCKVFPLWKGGYRKMDNLAVMEIYRRLLADTSAEKSMEVSRGGLLLMQAITSQDCLSNMKAENNTTASGRQKAVFFLVLLWMTQRQHSTTCL